MGEVESKYQKYEEIDCHGVIDEGDLQCLLRDRRNLPECDRQLIRHASGFISKHPSSVWKSARFSIHGEMISVVLTSGSEANQFVAAYDQDGQVNAYCTRKGWKMWFRDGMCAIWSTVQELAYTALSALSFIFKPSITF